MGEEKRMMAARAIILMDIFKVQVACGYGVPILTPNGFVPRDTIVNWGEKQVETGKLAEYQVKWNTKSLDGCKGLKLARRNAGESLLLGDLKARYWRIIKNWDAILVGMIMGIFFVFCVSLVYNSLEVGDVKSSKFVGDWWYSWRYILQYIYTYEERFMMKYVYVLQLVCKVIKSWRNDCTVQDKQLPNKTS